MHLESNYIHHSTSPFKLPLIHGLPFSPLKSLLRTKHLIYFSVFPICMHLFLTAVDFKTTFPWTRKMGHNLRALVLPEDWD